MIYEMTVVPFKKSLQNLLGILKKAEDYAAAKKIDFEVLLQSRLAPDQFALGKQIQTACDTAKLATARLSGKEAPVHADNEKTLTEFKDRIASVIKYLEIFTPSDFSKADEKHITTPRWEGKYLTGQEYALQHAIPNFYFHLVTAYSVLRHNGVDVGKKDYLGPMPFKG
jgi:hypothetical protein